ncbi:hypothetical protein ACFLZ9_00995 [Patescibacteria group bacterium]
MQSIKKALLFGFLIWLIPFVVSFPIFSLRETNRALFESIMPVTLSIVVVIFVCQYFKRLEKNYLKESIILSILWYFMPLLIDLAMFFPNSPMHMSFLEYMSDIGLTYVIIPIIIINSGYLMDRKIKQNETITIEKQELKEDNKESN